MNAWAWAAATTQWAAATAQTVVLVLTLRTRAQVAKLSNKIHNDLREMQKIDWTLAHELAAAAENDQLPPSTIQALHDLAERLRCHPLLRPAEDRTATHRPDNKSSDGPEERGQQKAPGVQRPEKSTVRPDTPPPTT